MWIENFKDDYSNVLSKNCYTVLRYYTEPLTPFQSYTSKQLKNCRMEDKMPYKIENMNESFSKKSKTSIWCLIFDTYSTKQ